MHAGVCRCNSVVGEIAVVLHLTRLLCARGEVEDLIGHTMSLSTVFEAFDFIELQYVESEVREVDPNTNAKRVAVRGDRDGIRERTRSPFKRSHPGRGVI
jgi:hypothetical protein